MAEEQKTILIVEDEALAAFLLKTKLAKWGFAVAGMAADGQTAVDMAERTHPDIVLMDIHLNGPMDGIDAARHIQHAGPIQIIFLTGYNNHGYRERAMELHPLAYLNKPVDMKELEQLVLAL